jgi:hypothetical protein
LQPTGDVDQYLEVAVSTAQPQHKPSSNTYAKTLHHNLFSMAVATHLINEIWDLYRNSFQSIVGRGPDIHNKLVIGETFYLLDDKWTSTTAGATYSLCCSSMCTTQFCDEYDKETVVNKLQSGYLLL